MSVPKEIKAPIGGWKVKTSFIVALIGVAAQIFGYEQYVNELYGVAAALGLLGVGHKAEKIKEALKEAGASKTE